MNCPACKTPHSPGQKFCGACGHKLEATCARCGAPNPPSYQYCGQCGASLGTVSTITLARSGLITRINQKALDLFGHKQKEMLGKPFSLFVERTDLVIFFSHLNELHSKEKHQSFEIKLKHAEAKSIYVTLDCRAEDVASGNDNDIHIVLSEVADHRLASDRMQYYQDLLGLMYSLTDGILSVSRRHFDIALEDALKKISLFAKAEQCFIYVINAQKRILEPAYHWCQPSSNARDCPKLKSVAMARIKRTIVRLRREQSFVVNDVSQLTPAERDELQAWHEIEPEALMCHIVYSGKRPVGVIGLANSTTDTVWTPECVALVKFFGQIAADRLPHTDFKRQWVEPDKPVPEAYTAGDTHDAKPADNIIDISAKQHSQPQSSDKKEKAPPETEPAATPRQLPDTTRPMLMEKLTDERVDDQQPVFPRDNGLIMLTCPRCGLQESVSLDQFKRLGDAISVLCQCRKKFAAVLEKRRAYRKAVQLEGYFSLKGDLGPVDAGGSIWGPMVVKDLSKAGLRFTTSKADLVHAGDLLMVRFNLDNSNHALIHKPARVISVNADQVGCAFEGSDSYDITLGFYFI